MRSDDRGTERDQRQMEKMKEKPKIKRKFNTWSTFAFLSSAMLSPQMNLNLLSTSLTNGQPAAYFWGAMTALVVWPFIYYYIFDLASRMPHIAGQMYWTAHLAPRKWSSFMSYCTGWLVTVSWVTLNCLVVVSAGSATLGLAAVYGDYTPTAWHIVLCSMAHAVGAGFVAIYLADHLHWLEIVVGVLHVIGIPVMCVLTIVLSPTRGAWDFLFEIAPGGWDNRGLEFVLGMYSTILLFIGYDCVVHMSFDVRSASTTLKRAGYSAFFGNWILVLLVNLTIGLCALQPDAIRASTTGLPYLSLVYIGTRSRPFTLAFGVMMVAFFDVAAVNELAAAARQVFGFAEYRGLPFSDWLKKIHKTRRVPHNATWLVVGISCALVCIIFVSATIFYLLLAFAGVALAISYLELLSLLWRWEWQGKNLPTADDSDLRDVRSARVRMFRLGGLTTAILGSTFIVVLGFFPSYAHPTALQMNWSVALCVFWVAVAAVWWFWSASKTYINPQTVADLSCVVNDIPLQSCSDHETMGVVSTDDIEKSKSR